MYSTCALSQAENDGAGEEHHNHMPNLTAPAYLIKNLMLLWLLLPLCRTSFCVCCKGRCSATYCV